MRLPIVGGYGAVGRPIIQLLENETPLTGLIERYRGWLEPVGSHGSSTIVPPGALPSSRQP